MAKTKVETDMYGETDTVEPDENNQTGGWEDGQSGFESGVKTPCKRHRWAGGTTCIRCGAQKSAVVASASDTPRATRGPRGGGFLETPVSIAWFAMGFGIERQPWIAQSHEVEGRPSLAEAVGGALKMESAVAGKRIDRAVRRTPVYKVIAPWFATAGIVSDLAPLLMPPLAMGLLAARPDIAENFKPLLVGMLVPVLAEQAKMAEQQMELLQNFDGVNAEVIEQAEQIIEAMISVKDVPKQPVGETVA